MRRRTPPLIGDHLIAPYGSGISEAGTIRPGDSAVIVFWSAGCEASLERLRQLASWHESAPTINGAPSVDIWTVHAPRFPAYERVEDAALAMDRHRIPFSALHDPDFKTWNRYNPEGWPTTILVDGGTVVGVDNGLAPMTGVLSRLSHRRDKQTNDGDHPPVATVTHPDGQEPDRLRYPTSVVVDGDRLLIADTGNNRVLAGRIRPDMSIFMVDRVYDGLTRPSSLVVRDHDTIAVVEDSRQISMIERSTGVKHLVTDQLVRVGGLCVDADGSLVATDAGGNRVHRIINVADSQSPPTWLARPIAGTGRLGTRAGRADVAEFAQPVAVARSPRGLVVADAASSALRLLTDSGKVMNITDGDLYRFGLVDGAAHRAFLQRPSGLCATTSGEVIVADSGNHALRLLAKRRVETLPIQGLRHPMAVASVDDDWLAVADTDNHRIVLANRHRGLVSELRLGGLTGSARATDIGYRHRETALVG